MDIGRLMGIERREVVAAEIGLDPDENDALQCIPCLIVVTLSEDKQMIPVPGLQKRSTTKVR